VPEEVLDHEESLFAVGAELPSRCSSRSGSCLTRPAARQGLEPGPFLGAAPLHRPVLELLVSVGAGTTGVGRSRRLLVVKRVFKQPTAFSM